jgi:hypothetical protein
MICSQEGRNGQRRWHVWGGGGVAYWVLMGKPEGNRSLRRHRHRRENITRDLRLGSWSRLIWLSVGKNGGLM